MERDVESRGQEMKGVGGRQRKETKKKKKNLW